MRFFYLTTLIFILGGVFLFGTPAEGRSGLKVISLPSPPTGPRQPLHQEVILETISHRPLSWAKVKGAALYHLQVASDPQFRRILISVYLSPNQFTIKALPKGTFFWRVSSINKEGMEGKFSPVWYFVYPLRTPFGRFSEVR